MAQGEVTDRDAWPLHGPHRDFLESLDRVRRDNGNKSLRTVSKRALVAYSGLSEILRGLRLPSDSEQVAAVVKGLGGGDDEVQRAKALYSKITIADRPHARRKSSPRTHVAGLPLVNESTDLDARVLKAVFEIPYIERDAESQVKTFVDAGEPVLLVGSSMVGKTRVAVEVIRRQFADRPLIMSETIGDFASLLASPQPLESAVVFLDDVDRLIGVAGLSQSAFKRLASANAVIATIRSRLYDEYLPSDAPRLVGWDLLAQFSPVFLRRDLSQKELAGVGRTIDDPEVRRRITSTGIGEYVGAARTTAQRLQIAPESSPVGYALIRGCADWARMGIRTPTPAGLLRALAANHIEPRRAARLRGAGYEEALEWATSEINPTISILQPEPDNGYTVFDYALDILAEEGSPIPDAAWQLAIGSVSPSELIDLANSAAKAEQDDVAEQALRSCEASRDADAAPLAAMLLGPILSRRGDVEGAIQAYRRAIDSSHADASPGALFNLGGILRSQGANERAIDCYRQAIESKHASITPLAAVNLGLLLTNLDDLEGAEAAFRQVTDHTFNSRRMEAEIREKIQHMFAGRAIVMVADIRQRRPAPEVFTNAELGLADVLTRRGDVLGAREAYERAGQDASDDLAVKVAFSLGCFLLVEGNLADAQACFERTLDGGASGSMAAKATFNLGALHLQRRELTEAEVFFRQALDMDYPPVAATAAVYLAALLTRRADHDELDAIIARADALPMTEDTVAALEDMIRLYRAPHGKKSSMFLGAPEVGPSGDAPSPDLR